jgi:hypothetical protein
MDALSSAELAQMALPMMPKSKQGVEYHAKKRRGHTKNPVAKPGAAS